MASNTTIDRIVLGTAALGQPYGIANPKTVITPAETEAVLTASWSRGIRCIDTAPVYGDAERRIGNWSRRTGTRFRTISKLPPMDDISDSDVDATIRLHLKTTFQNLCVDYLEGYLLHNPGDFTRLPVRETLRTLQEEKKVGVYGLSVNDPGEAMSALSIDRVGAFQVPTNLFDSRIKDSGLKEECAAGGLHLYLRSVFLQGLIFREPSSLPGFFTPIYPKLRAFQNLSEDTKITPSHLALSYILQIDQNSHIVIGCRHTSEVEELCDIVAAPPLDASIFSRLQEIGDGTETTMIDPRSWPLPS